VHPVLNMLPDAEVWHLGMYRDEQTLEPVSYYHKLPDDDPPDLAFVVDPMLATGGSIAAAIAALRHWGVADVRVLALIAAPEGVARVEMDYPDVALFVCAVDEKLDDVGRNPPCGVNMNLGVDISQRGFKAAHQVATRQADMHRDRAPGVIPKQINRP